MGNTKIENLLLRMLQGDASTNEIEEFREWMSASEENKNLFDSIKEYWEQSSLEVHSEETEQAYVRLHERMSSKDKIVRHPASLGKRNHWWKIAAIIIFFLCFGGLLVYVNDQNRQQSEQSILSETIKQNPKGQKLTTYLPDGSKVILNSQSSIRYISSFTENERHVKLEGEAFFEVAKDSTRPFIVNANGVTTVALGTSFNINSKTNNSVEVMLVTGKVKVSTSDQKFVFLDPGKSAQSDENGDLQIQEFDYLDKIGWKDGILVFKKNSISEIVEKLEDWYAVEIHLEGAVDDNFHYSGSYKNKTLEEVLEGISYAFHFNYKINNNQVNINV